MADPSSGLSPAEVEEAALPASAKSDNMQSLSADTALSPADSAHAAKAANDSSPTAQGSDPLVAEEADAERPASQKISNRQTTSASTALSPQSADSALPGGDSAGEQSHAKLSGTDDESASEKEEARGSQLPGEDTEPAGLSERPRLMEHVLSDVAASDDDVTPSPSPIVGGTLPHECLFKGNVCCRCGADRCSKEHV